MAKVKTKNIVVGPSFYKIVPEKKRHTRYIQTSSGLMRGRRLVAKPQSDNTRVAVMVKNFDVNKDRKIDDRDLKTGQIIGRVSPAGKKRNVEVQKHYRQGRVIRRHVRIIR